MTRPIKILYLLKTVMPPQKKFLATPLVDMVGLKPSSKKCQLASCICFWAPKGTLSATNIVLVLVVINFRKFPKALSMRNRSQ